MTKAPIIVKRALDVALGVLVLAGVALLVALVASSFGAGRGVIQMPVRVVHEEAVPIESEIFGVGEVTQLSGTADFPFPAAPWATLLFLVGIALSLGAALILILLMRRIVATVVAGEPFAEANIDRIRAIGFLVIAFEFLAGAVRFGLETLTMATAKAEGLHLVALGEWNVSTLALGAVVVALAEVFRYGVQLQSDADLTV